MARALPPPVYRELDRSGPDHAPRFRIGAEVSGFASSEGEGRSKRIAEQAAAVYEGAQHVCMQVDRMDSGVGAGGLTFGDRRADRVDNYCRTVHDDSLSQPDFVVASQPRLISWIFQLMFGCRSRAGANTMSPTETCSSLRARRSVHAGKKRPRNPESPL